MPSTIALFGSARRNGNTGQFMDCVAQELRIEVVDLGAKRLSPFEYEHRNRNDDFEPIMTRVLKFEQIIFASPVYWYAVSPPVKIFLDRISDYLDLPELLEHGRRLRGKTGFVLCTSIDDAVAPSFIESFQQTFEYLGMRYGGCAHANCRDGFRLADHEAEAKTFVERVRGTAT